MFFSQFATKVAFPTRRRLESASNSAFLLFLIFILFPFSTLRPNVIHKRWHKRVEEFFDLIWCGFFFALVRVERLQLCTSLFFFIFLHHWFLYMFGSTNIQTGQKASLRLNWLIRSRFEYTALQGVQSTNTLISFRAKRNLTQENVLVLVELVCYNNCRNICK